jgi:hypothetical protein
MQSTSWSRTRPLRPRAWGGVLAAGLLLTALACSGDSPEAGPSPGAPGAASPTSDPTDTATWSVGITSAPTTATAPPLPVLTALRAGSHPEYERVTFEIAGAPDEGGAADTAESSAAGLDGASASGLPAGRPGYKLEYVDRPLIACGSGDQIFPVGDGWLEIRLEPAAAHTEAGQPTLGPREVEVDGPLLQRIYRTCDFEGIVTYVLALGSPNEYRVFTLADPLRIVVDVRR